MDIKYPIGKCNYCEEERHLRELKLFADTIDEVKEEMVSAQVGKYTICEECLEFLDRLLMCNVNLRTTGKEIAEKQAVIQDLEKKKKILETENQSLEPINQVANKVPIEVNTKFHGFRKFGIATNHEEISNFCGWELLRIIRNAEQYTEYAMSKVLIRHTDNSGTWVEEKEPDPDDTSVYPLTKIKTHYLFGLPISDVIDEMKTKMDIMRSTMEEFEKRVKEKEQENEVMKMKQDDIIKALDEANLKIAKFRATISLLKSEHEKSEQKIKTMQTKLTNAGVRDIELDDKKD